MNLPTYELRIDPEKQSFVDAIALVESPAIESDFIAFSKEQKDISFSMDDTQMELIGAAMVPNMLIYRKDKTGAEYNVYFSSETIRSIAQVFAKNSFQKNMNLEHTSVQAHSYVFQSYIVDSTKGMYSPLNLNLVDGSWVVGVKVQDPNVWNDIKSGKVRGFSVEGIFELIKQDFAINHSANTINNINDLVEETAILKDINKYFKILINNGKRI